jgi:integrase
MGRLSVATVRNAKAGRHADGDGLYLLVKPTGGKSWLLRIQVDGRRRDIGLGTADVDARAGSDLIEIPLLHRKRLSLSEARDKCAALRKAAVAGLDPVQERDRDRRGIPNFEQVTEQTHAALKSGWAPRQQDAFLSSLKTHVFPTLGRRRVDQIAATDIQSVLEPIWTSKPDAARKVRQRIATVLNFAHTKGWRQAEAPLKSVSMALPKAPKGGNYAAMPYPDLPAFVASLKAQVESVGRLALLFTILTAARSGEVRHARWSHMDLQQKLWNRPAELMKGRVAHIVTLSDQAIDVLKRMKLFCTAADGLCFPSARSLPLSDMTLSKIMRDARLPYTVHGFRSSFRDWAAEAMPDIPDPVAETALAHAVPDMVVAAYKRTNFIELRRTLLGAWGQHCTVSESCREAT